MSNYKGIYIDDDEANYRTYSRFFKSYDIELVPYENLEDDPSAYYDKILKYNVDFVIIDYDFSIKGVNYNGIDVLKSIRARDPEIYIVYLTEKEFQDAFLKDFDIAIHKSELETEIDILCERLNRALSRDLSIKMEREIDISYEQRQKYFDAQIEILEKKLKKL